MTFKMSEVFELPVKKTQGGVLPFLRDSNPMCNSIFVGSDNHVDATVIAINAYDANQLEIAELKQLAETKNARTLERIGRIEQQEREISELKASHRNELSKVNSDVQHILSTGVTIAKNLDGAASEIECLKKQVSQLKSENSSMAAYAEQRINMLTRVNNKLREGKS